MFCTDLIMASNRKFEVHSNFMSQSIKQIVPGLHSANNLNIVWPGQIYERAVNWNMRPHEHFNNSHTTKATSKVGRTTLSSKPPYHDLWSKMARFRQLVFLLNGFLQFNLRLMSNITNKVWFRVTHLVRGGWLCVMRGGHSLLAGIDGGDNSLFQWLRPRPHNWLLTRQLGRG